MFKASVKSAGLFIIMVMKINILCSTLILKTLYDTTVFINLILWASFTTTQLKRSHIMEIIHLIMQIFSSFFTAESLTLTMSLSSAVLLKISTASVVMSVSAVSSLNSLSIFICNFFPLPFQLCVTNSSSIFNIHLKNDSNMLIMSMLIISESFSSNKQINTTKLAMLLLRILSH